MPASLDVAFWHFGIVRKLFRSSIHRPYPCQIHGTRQTDVATEFRWFRPHTVIVATIKQTAKVYPAVWHGHTMHLIRVHESISIGFHASWQVAVHFRAGFLSVLAHYRYGRSDPTA